MSLTADEMTAYRASARMRQQRKSACQRQRHQLGLAVAQQAGKLLKGEFNVEKVVLFGSMLALSPLTTPVIIMPYGVVAILFYMVIAKGNIPL
jgi:hypothetical protein